MQRLIKKIGLGLAVLYLFACSGGGCSTCEGCGVEPIPGGFPNGDRISNSAQVRLTSSGIQFLEDNADAIVATLIPEGLTFPIPRSSGSTTGIDYTLCPDNDCFAAGEIRELQLTPTPPNRLQVLVRIIVDSRGPTADRRRAIPVEIDPPILPSSTCDVDIDTRGGSRPHIGAVANLDFVAETRAPRTGYTRLVVESVNITEGVEDDDVDIGGCGYAWLLNLFKGTLVDQIAGELDSTIQGAIDDQLCTTQGDYGCPTGTVPDNGDTSDPNATCVFEGTSECVPLLLGADGQGDLGAAALGSISPGTHAPGQFLLAAGGDGEAVNNGLSLFFFGGFRSTDRSFENSPAHNSCVPVIEEPPLPDIPRVDTFRANSIPGGGEAHVGVGLSEPYLDHAGYGIFDSGMLCLGAGTRLSQQLSTGLFSVLIRSLPDLTFPDTNSPLSIALRPQKPLQFTVGDTAAGEPLLTAELDELEMDFYVWSTERYIRFLTFKGDMSIPIRLSVEGNQLVPMLEDINVENAEVLNSDLLEERPETLAPVLKDVFGSFAGMLGGSIGGFDLPDLMGFRLNIPEDGIVGFEDSGTRFVGIFGDLEVTGGGAYTATTETSLELSDLRLDERAMQLETWGEGELPSVHLWMEADGPAGVDYEYSYRVDGKGWSEWTSDYHVVVQDRALLFQGKHYIEARSRIAGEPRTVDSDPARQEIVVDILPPEVSVERAGEQLHVQAYDIVTADGDLEYRYRVDDGTFGEWEAFGEDVTIRTDYVDTPVEVEVRDEAGNIGRAEPKIIRGLPDSSADGGCGCTVPGEGSGSAVLGGLALFGLLAWRRRRSAGSR